MRHQTIKNYLLLYVDGQLDARKKAEISEHLQHCTACAALVQQLQSLMNAPERMSAMKAPDYLWTRLQARLRHQAQISKPHGELQWRPLMATLLIAVALTVGFFLGDLPLHSEMPVTESQSLRASYYTDMLEPFAPPTMVEAVHQFYEQAGEGGQ